MALTTNLYSYWKLEDNTDSVWWNTLTVNGATSGASGKISNCYDFDGVNDNLNKTGLSKAFTAITVSLWFNADTISGWWENRCFHLENSSNQSIIYLETYLGKYYAICWVGWSNWVLNPTTPTPPTSTWTHYVVTHTGSAMEMYINGSSVATGWSAWFSVTADEVIIGWTTSSWWDWKIDEVWLWDRALSWSEITELYNWWSWKSYPFLTTQNSNFFQFL